MPEQDTKTPTVPAPSAPTRAQASDEMGSVAFAGPTPQVRRLVLIPVIGAVIILGVDIVLALQTSAWQLFAAAGFLATPFTVRRSRSILISNNRSFSCKYGRISFQSSFVKRPNIPPLSCSSTSLLRGSNEER